MNKIILALILGVLFASKSLAWVTTYDDYYKYKVLPKLDEISQIILAKASTLISNIKPSFEVQLTREERYFSSETMAFLGEDNPQPKYSGVVWRAVWVQGQTLIVGWAKADKKYYVSYVYTVDKNLIFPNAIRVGADTNVLEKLFQAKLYDFSAKYGSVGHLQEVFGGDFALALGLLIEYDNGLITNIMAIDEFVSNDLVPLVPRSTKIDDFVKRKTDELNMHSLTREIPQHIDEINTSPNNAYPQIMPPVGETYATSTSTNGASDTIDVVFIALGGGALISIVLVIILTAYLSSNSHAQSRGNYREEARKEHDDIQNIEDISHDDFDYPYEDIEEAMKL